MLEEKIVQAIVDELLRQAAAQPKSLTVEQTDGVKVNGTIDIEALAMAIAGSVAGGP